MSGISSPPVTRTQRVIIALGTAIVCGMGAVPIYYRRKDRAQGSNFETMAEKLAAQEARAKAAERKAAVA
jgi:hypothetical protein